MKKSLMVIMMTEKRYSYFKSQLTGLYVICDGKHKETFNGMDDEYNCSRIVRKLNILTDENEQLKKEGADVERLIDDLGSEELRRQYEEIKNEEYGLVM